MRDIREHQMSRENVTIIEEVVCRGDRDVDLIEGEVIYSLALGQYPV